MDIINIQYLLRILACWAIHVTHLFLSPQTTISWFQNLLSETCRTLPLTFKDTPNTSRYKPLTTGSWDQPFQNLLGHTLLAWYQGCERSALMWFSLDIVHCPHRLLYQPWLSHSWELLKCASWQTKPCWLWSWSYMQQGQCVPLQNLKKLHMRMAV